MLRIGGVLAVLASAALAIVLFTHLRSFDLTGTAEKVGPAPLTVELRSRPTSQELLFFCAVQTITDDGHVTRLIFDDAGEEARSIPENAVVDIRQVVFVMRRPLIVFEGTSIRSGGRSCPCGRSLLTFYGTLSLICMAPLFLWSAAALVLVSKGGKPQP